MSSAYFTRRLISDNVFNFLARSINKYGPSRTSYVQMGISFLSLYILLWLSGENETMNWTNGD